VIGSQQISVALIAQTLPADASGFFASPGNAVELASRVGEAALQAIMVIIVTFYFLVDGAALRDRTVRVLPFQHRTRTIVVGRAVHLHPVVTIFAVLVGLSTYGVLGGLLGVPIAAAANVVFRELAEPEIGLS
jgi:predicted PurR-regulated permease PerM